MMKYLTRVAICLLLFVSPITAFAENANFTTSHFSGSGNCATCHDGLTDTSGENVSIVRDWGASMMANATKDPFWQAKVATELKRNPDLSTVINDTCSKCHAPMANYEITQVQGGEISLFGADGILNPNHALYDAAMNGVSCTVCHQITDDATLGTLAGFSGNYNINDTKTIYGQYSDIFGQPMVNNTGFTPAYSAHVSDSAMCATCHNLKTPFVDAEGNVISTTPESGFPEQMPYTEWQQSIFDDAGSNPQSCQDCHMTDTTSKVSNRPRWLGTKAGFAKHQLVGANTTMLTLLRDNAAQLDVTSSNMDLGIDRARAMLQSSVSLNIESASVTNGVLEARVRLDNNSGHKTPSGYPSRRMWLHFKVTDSNNNVVFESGRVNTDGSIVGVDVDDSRTIPFEPHYNLIEKEVEVQVYEPVMGDSDGNLTYTLLRGARYLKDNRLTPKGFNKFNAPADVAVLGKAANDASFNQGSDEITYRFDVAASGDLTVSVSLNYQTIGYGFLQDLYSDADLEQVQTFKAMYDAQSLKYEQITSAQTTVVSDGGGTPPPVLVPTATLTATPTTITDGESVDLSWSSTYATNCTVSDGVWSDTGTTGSVLLYPHATTTYTLNCNGAGGSASDSATVTVNAAPAPVPTATLTAAPTTITVGESVNLSWSSTDATSCTVSGGGWSDAGTNGSVLLYPAATTTYTLNCDGASDSATVTVNAAPEPVPTATLTAAPTTITAGESVDLSWSSTDATSCTVSGGDWSDTGTNGSVLLYPAATATYTLNCNGAGGSANDSVTVTVNTPPTAAQPTVNLTASPSRIARGNTITLSWSSTDATSCTASGGWSGSQASSGSLSLSLSAPATFTLSCSGDGGSASDSVRYAARGRRWLELR